MEIDGESKWILFVGTNRMLREETYSNHGFNFKKGKLYKVTPEVWQFVKSLRGFEACSGIGSEEIIDFPKKKEPTIAKSFVNKWDEQRKRIKESRAKKR